jgi:hypothetical protein
MPWPGKVRPKIRSKRRILKWDNLAGQEPVMVDTPEDGSEPACL